MALCFSEWPSPDQAAVPDYLGNHVPAATDPRCHPGFFDLHHVCVQAQKIHLKLPISILWKLLASFLSAKWVSCVGFHCVVLFQCVWHSAHPAGQLREVLDPVWVFLLHHCDLLYGGLWRHLPRHLAGSALHGPHDLHRFCLHSKTGRYFSSYDIFTL